MTVCTLRCVSADAAVLITCGVCLVCADGANFWSVERSLLDEDVAAAGEVEVKVVDGALGACVGVRAFVDVQGMNALTTQCRGRRTTEYQ